MAELSNSLKFTRINSDGIYYSDLKASLKHSVKFDIFEDIDQTATLLTNNRKTLTLTKDNVHLSIKSKWSWRNKWTYFIFQNDNVLIATIYIHRPMFWGWFRPSVHNITFEKTNLTYSLTGRRQKDWKYSNADFYYDLILNGEIKCSIINLKKKKGFYNPTTIAHEGIIEYDNSVSLVQILCFLQLVNINIDLDFSI